MAAKKEITNLKELFLLVAEVVLLGEWPEGFGPEDRYVPLGLCSILEEIQSNGTISWELLEKAEKLQNSTFPYNDRDWSTYWWGMQRDGEDESRVAAAILLSMIADKVVKA